MALAVLSEDSAGVFFVYQKNPHASKSKGEYNTTGANKQDANDMQAELMPTDALQ